MVTTVEAQKGCCWGVVAPLPVALAAGAALLGVRPAAVYITRPDLQISGTD
jgi:hypothetical protein